jgi:two-component system sensor histidine kinase ResE
MLEGALGALSEQQREALQRMQNSAQRLSRMACSLYDLSLARRSQMRIQFSVQPIEDCIDQAVHELAFLTEEKRISITVQLTPYHGRRLSFDPTRIVQLVVNLLDNACRFTPKYGAVEVLGYPFFWERRSGSGPVAAVERRHLRCQEPNCCRLDISDTGPGIPREFVPLIFEEYTSYAGPEDRSGGGLGLAICRTIAQAHGGNIWANSKIDGATFSVVLPFENPEGGRRDRIPWDVSFAGVEDGNGGDSQSREER